MRRAARARQVRVPRFALALSASTRPMARVVTATGRVATTFTLSRSPAAAAPTRKCKLQSRTAPVKAVAAARAAAAVAVAVVSADLPAQHREPGHHAPAFMPGLFLFAW